jgi:GTP-binding protein HflX
MMVFNKVDAYSFVEKDEFDLTPSTKENMTMDELKQTWIAKLGNDCVFMSALTKEGIDDFRLQLYQRVRQLHVQRFPYNDFLYPLAEDLDFGSESLENI